VGSRSSRTPAAIRVERIFIVSPSPSGDRETISDGVRFWFASVRRKSRRVVSRVERVVSPI
jgi:hypothetical protein